MEPAVKPAPEAPASDPDADALDVLFREDEDAAAEEPQLSLLDEDSEGPARRRLKPAVRQAD